jgi:hypothetical protein
MLKWWEWDKTHNFTWDDDYDPSIDGRRPREEQVGYGSMNETQYKNWVFVENEREKERERQEHVERLARIMDDYWDGYRLPSTDPRRYRVTYLSALREALPAVLIGVSIGACIAALFFCMGVKLVVK